MVMGMEDGYTIEQAATLTGVTRDTLRYYEKIGLLARVPRNQSGHRRYQDDNLGAVRFLTLLRQTGMPIREVQRFVHLTRSGDETIPDRVELLESHRSELAVRLSVLTDQLAAIDYKIGIYRGLLDERIDQAAPSTKESTST